MKSIVHRSVSFSLLMACLICAASQVRTLNSKTRAASLNPAAVTRAMMNETYARLPLSFEVNRGQVDASIKFISRGGNYNLSLAPTGATLHLTGASANQSATVRIKPVNANPSPKIEGADQLPGKSNYLIGSDRTRWRTNITNYARARYKQLWPGVDAVFYGNQRNLEYDFVVAPGADPRVIELVFDGAERVSIDENGDLVLDTTAGEIRQRKPVIYQEAQGSRREVIGSYVLKGERRIGFRVADYDRRVPLVIDPVALIYGTYLGGAGDDGGSAIAVDSEGNAYVTGSTASSDFPAPGALQGQPGGSGDAFIVKINPLGTEIVYATYLGGKGSDRGSDIAVDATGNVYVAGATTSDNFPLVNAIQRNYGGAGDGFMAKLNAGGSALIYSTYLGGNNADDAAGLAIDAMGNAYVTGSTLSTNFPLVNPIQTLRLNQKVFKSADGGNGWTLSQGGLVGINVNRFAIDPASTATIYAATPYDVFKSADSGANWSVTGAGAGVSELVIDPKTPATLYAAIGKDIIKSLNGGVNWQVSSDGLPGDEITGLAIDPKTPATLYVAVRKDFGTGSTSKFYKSVNGGGNWTELNVGSLGEPVGVVAIDPLNPTTIYFGAQVGLFKSADGGASLSQVKNGTSSFRQVVSIAIDPLVSGVIYVVESSDGRTRVLQSMDGGGAWRQADAGLADIQVNRLMIDPRSSNVIYALTVAGLYKSVDGASRWNRVGASTLPEASVVALGIDPIKSDTLYLGVEFDRQKAYVAKLKADGSAFVYSTYLGGARPDWGRAIAVDKSGAAYVTGRTQSLDFPTTEGAYQRAGGGSDTVFGVKFNADGSSLGYSTYIGKGVGADIAVDDEGNAYLTGEAAPSFPATPAALAEKTAFVTKLNASGASLSYSSRITLVQPGSFVFTTSRKIALDGSGAAFVCGNEVMPPFNPRTDVGYNRNFVIRIGDAGGPVVFWDSGGDNNDLAIDTKGNIYVTGVVSPFHTISPPTTPATFQPQRKGGMEAFVLRFKFMSVVNAVSAASYRGPVAGESIAAVFGSDMARTTQPASSLPLPTELGGVRVKVRYGAVVESFAPLFYVSPSQLNCVIPPIPPELPAGQRSATMIVMRGDEPVASGSFIPAAVAPGVFSADSSGRGLVAAVALRQKPDNTQIYESIIRFDPAQNKFVAIPIDLGPDGDRVFLAIFGTGWRFRNSETSAKVMVGGVEVPVLYVGAQGMLSAVDQINVELTRTLAGKGEVDLEVMVDGNVANTTRVSVK